MLSTNKLNKIWNVGIYVRISESDRNHNEYDSIYNQKRYIEKYIDRDSSLNTYKIYSDDGTSGGTYNRSAFNSMISDIEKGHIDSVIVKDLSRLGRDKNDTNRLLEIYFPTNKIRFISIKESVDSYLNPDRINNLDIAFTTMINDHYLTQVSISTKSSLQIKRKEGKYVGSKAPYGYLKSPNDKYKLIVDENVKNVIETIYNNYTSGVALRDIACNLNRSRVDTPAKYRAKESSVVRNNKWSSAIVRKILNQPIYYGDMVQGRTYSPNHKVKKRMIQDRDKWIIVKDTHDAIIDKNTYKKAEDLLLRDIKPIRTRSGKAPESLLAGYVYSEDCGKRMVRSFVTYKEKRTSRFVCSTYKKKGKEVCSSHVINEEIIIDSILGILNIHARVFLDHDKVRELLKQANENKITSLTKSKLKKKEIEFAEIKQFRSSLYKDYKRKVITSIEYSEMKVEFERNYLDLYKEIDFLKKQIEKEEESKLPLSETLDYFEKYHMMEKLTRKAIIQFICRVNVSNAKKIQIVFNYKDPMKTNPEMFEKFATSQQIMLK